MAKDLEYRVEALKEAMDDANVSWRRAKEMLEDHDEVYRSARYELEDALYLAERRYARANDAWERAARGDGLCAGNCTPEDYDV